MNELHDAEYQDHARMWESFTKLMTGSVIFVILVLLGMAVTIA